METTQPADNSATESVESNATLQANTQGVIADDAKDLDVGATTQLDSDANTKSAEVSSLLDSLPPELKSEPSLQNFKDVSSLAKSYVSAQQMIGRSIRIPTEDASPEAMEEFYSKLSEVPGLMRKPNSDDPEAMNQFYNSLGRPETADKYEVKLPEEIQGDPEMINGFKQIAHNLGLTQKQVAGLAEFEAMRTNGQLEQMSAQKEYATTALKEKWGSDFDARLNGAKAALNHYSEQFPDAIQEIANSPVGNNPAFIAMLSELGGMLQESGSLQGKSSVSYGVSAEEARERINEIRLNSSHPFHNPSDPDHKAAVEKMRQFYSAAYPDE